MGYAIADWYKDFTYWIKRNLSVYGQQQVAQIN